MNLMEWAHGAYWLQNEGLPAPATEDPKATIYMTPSETWAIRRTDDLIAKGLFPFAIFGDAVYDKDADVSKALWTSEFNGGDSIGPLAAITKSLWQQQYYIKWFEGAQILATEIPNLTHVGYAGTNDWYCTFGSVLYRVSDTEDPSSITELKLRAGYKIDGIPGILAWYPLEVLRTFTPTPRQKEAPSAPEPPPSFVLPKGYTHGSSLSSEDRQQYHKNVLHQSLMGFTDLPKK